MEKYDEFAILFLKKTLLGRETKFKNAESVINACISVAYKDMLTAGKYYLDADLKKGDEEKKNRNIARRKEFFELLQQCEFAFSLDLIKRASELFGTEEEIRSGVGYATRLGLSQKLVNMTFKYFYVFKNEIGLDIDFSGCDCPIDSIILEKLKLDSTYVWSKLSMQDYAKIQYKIDSIAKESPEYPRIGRLIYDFTMW